MKKLCSLLISLCLVLALLCACGRQRPEKESTAASRELPGTEVSSLLPSEAEGSSAQAETKTPAETQTVDPSLPESRTAPTEAVTEAEASEASEEPARASSEESSRAPAPTSAESSAPAPTERPIEAPTQAPAERPTEAPTQAPTERPTEAPARSSEAVPAETAAQTDPEGSSEAGEGSTAESSEGSSPAERVTLTVSAIGDCTLGNDVDQPYDRCFNTVYLNQGSDPGYFLGKVKPILAADDLTIANLESVLTDRGSEADKMWSFRGLPEYAKIFSSASVEAVTFANNHNRDYGEISYTDTIDNLAAEGIPTAVEDRTLLLNVKGIKVGLIAIQSAFLTGEGTANREYCDTDALKRSTASYIADLRDRGAQLIIAAYHWGIESVGTVSAQQKALGHYAVDQGADLVLGSHPHCLQPVEYYNGKYIIYSLANFCFGGHTNPGDKDSFIWQQDFVFADGVLESSDDARMIPCSISGSTERNDYQPTPSGAADSRRIINRMNTLCQQAGISLRFSPDTGCVSSR